MSLSKYSSSCCNGRESSGSGFTESKRSLNLSTLTKGVHMTLLKSMWKAVMLASVAGVLMFAGGAFAADPGDACDLVEDSGEDDGLLSSDGVTCKDPTGYVAVTGITGIPTTGSVGTTTLTGTVAPNNATNKTIVWSVKSAGMTGATISGTTLTTTSAGTVKVTATIEDGKTIGEDFEVDEDVVISSGYVAVTGITGIPTTGSVGTTTLTGTVAPNNATNKTIVWSVKSAGTTGATISGTTLTTTGAGTVKVTATITNGLTASSDFTFDADIVIAGAWSNVACTNVDDETKFLACWGAMAGDKNTANNPLNAFIAKYDHMWVVGDGTATVTETIAKQAVADSVTSIKSWWTTNTTGIFAANYNPNFTVADATVTLPETYWKAPKDAASASDPGEPGYYLFDLKLGEQKITFNGAQQFMIEATPKAYSSATPPVTGVQIVVTGPTEPNKTIVHGTVAITDVFTVTGNIANVTPAGSKDNTLEYCWFKTAAADGTQALTDPNAPGSTWKSAAANGNIYSIPTDIAVSAGGHWFYCRVRTTMKKAGDPTKDSLDMKTSQSRKVVVTTRPVIDPGTAALGGGATAKMKVGSVTGTIGVTGASTAPNEGTLSYQWYFNSANTVEGGIEASGLSAATATYTIPTNLQAGFYYYFCEVRNVDAKAAPERTEVIPVEIEPKDVGVVSLPTRNVVQVSNGIVAYARGSSAMKLTLPAAAGLVSPAITGHTFAVTKVIYEKGGVYTWFVGDGAASGADGTAENKALPVADHKVAEAGVYNVTVVVKSTAASGDVYEGSRTVTLTVTRKELSAITQRGVTPLSVVYDGKTKVPTLNLVDGSGTTAYPLVPTTDYTRVDGDLTNAGTAKITLTGAGNYTGTLELTFAITKKEISVDVTATRSVGGQIAGLTRNYNGTKTVDADKLTSLDVKFINTVNAGDLSNGFGYIVKSLEYDDPNAGVTTRAVNGVVELDTSTAEGASLGRNYTFAGGSISSSFSLSGVTINKATPVATDFDFTIPTNKFFTGSGQGIGTVAWQSKYTSTGDTRTVYYNGNDGLGALTTLPVGSATEDKVFAVTLKVTGSNNFVDNTVGISLGNFTIKQPQKPAVVVTDSVGSDKRPVEVSNAGGKVNAYIGDEVVLRTVVTKPDSAKTDKVGSPAGTNDSSIAYKSGTLSYVWFIDTAGTTAPKWDTLKIGNAVVRTATFAATFTAADTATEKNKIRRYKAEVTYSNPTVQAPTVQSDSAQVRIWKEREDIAAAVVTVGGTYTYTGKTANVSKTSVTVTLNGVKLNNNNENDYKFDVFGEDAGVGVVSVTGINAYKGKASGTFTIAKKTTAMGDLKFSPAATSVPYNGAAQALTVSPSFGEGLGAVTVTYVNLADEENPVTLTAAPKNAGKYKTVIAIAEGKNFTEFEEFERPYVITQRFVERSDFNYTMPKNGATPTAITATLKNPMGYTGTLTTVYTNVATEANLNAVPTTEGRYAVKVRVGGDDNFGMVVVTLDTLKIDSNGKVGVKSSDREVPKSVETNVAAVAPVKVVASGFTAGPSPVKTGSAIKFFSAKSVKSGTLYIFNANGNSVAKVSAKSASGEIGSWNLKDKKGAAVSEGTYVVKGALVGKDGSKEKVSFPFSVVK